MTYVERYHTLIRHAYKIVTSEAPELDPETAQNISVISVNNSTWPDGLVPTFLVYRALPRLGLPTHMVISSTYQRAVAFRKVTEALLNHAAKTQVSSAVRSRNGPDTLDIHSARIYSHMLVYLQE